MAFHFNECGRGSSTRMGFWRRLGMGMEHAIAESDVLFEAVWFGGAIFENGTAALHLGKRIQSLLGPRSRGLPISHGGWLRRNAGLGEFEIYICDGRLGVGNVTEFIHAGRVCG